VRKVHQSSVHTAPQGAVGQYDRAMLGPFTQFYAKWIVAGRAIRYTIVKAVRRKLCHCSLLLHFLCQHTPLVKGLAHHGFKFFSHYNFFEHYIGVHRC